MDPATSTALGLALAYLVVFLVNLAPALMPPTWAILAFFLISYDLPLLPLAIGGALAASAGRLVLALASRRWGRRLLSRQRQTSLGVLGGWLEARARWAAPLAVLVYSFGPIPSNELFIVAGLTRMRLAPIVGAFLAGRLVSYTFWVGAAHLASQRLEDLFAGHLRSGGALLLELLALALLVLAARLDWRPLLGRAVDHAHATASADRGPARGARTARATRP
jgi:membrane protein DedA with SNARE-associated domain